MDFLINNNENYIFEQINVSKLIKIFKDIKQINDAFPELTIQSKSEFNQLKISNLNSLITNCSEMELEFNDKNIWIVKSHTFPKKAASSLKLGSSTSIKNAVESFTLINNNLTDYYEALENLMLSCSNIICEPKLSTPNITWRLLKYSRFVFIKVEFDPLNVSNLKVTFFGKQQLVNDLYEIYNKAYEKKIDEGNDESEEEDVWSNNIYRKLCSQLNVLEFPSLCEEADAEPDVCPICLCDDEIAFVCCNNLKCQSIFHANCLAQQVLNINCVKVLSVAIAICPLCKERISTNFISMIQSKIE